MLQKQLITHGSLTMPFSPNTMKFLGRPRQKGFTLLEILIVIIVVSIIFVVGANTRTYQVDAKKYKETIEKLRVIQRALGGDDRLFNEGMRADFGYYGAFRSWPAPADLNGDGTASELPISVLDDFLPPMPSAASYNYYTQDAWGNYFTYQVDVDTPVQYGGGSSTYKGIEVRSNAQDAVVGVSKTIFDSDVRILLRKDLFEDNLVYISVLDSLGVSLRGMPFVNPNSAAAIPAAAQTDVHQIYRVVLLDLAGNVVLDTESFYSSIGSPQSLFYSQSLFLNRFPYKKPFTFSNLIGCGYYKLRVYPSFGGSGSKREGAFDHRDDLSDNNNYLEQIVPIYPKDPLAPNYLVFKFPGRLDLTER